VDKQLEGYQETIFGSLPALVSIPKSRIEGGELNLFWKPSQAIKINIGGTYIDSEVTSNYYGSPVFASSGSATVDYKGMAFPFTPKWAVTSDFQYDIPVSSRITGYVGGGPNYHSSTTAAFAGGPSSISIPSRCWTSALASKGRITSGPSDFGTQRQ